MTLLKYLEITDFKFLESELHGEEVRDDKSSGEAGD
jgi:hypothetical protein